MRYDALLVNSVEHDANNETEASIFLATVSFTDWAKMKLCTLFFTTIMLSGCPEIQCFFLIIFLGPLLCRQVIDRMTLAATIALILFITKPVLAEQNHNDIYGLNRTIITGPPVPAMLRRDQARAETGESTIRKQMDKTKFYYSLDVKRIIGWARSSMPGATDIELSLMLSLWIWGFSVLNFISVLVLCFWRNMALA